MWVTRSVIVIFLGLLEVSRNKDRNVDANFLNGEKRDTEYVKEMLTIQEKDGYIYVICQLGLENAAFSRPSTQFFAIRTDP